MTLGQAFADRRNHNNFDLIRLWAAALVLFSHSYPLTGTPEFFSRIIRHMSGGSLAVAVFFAISGFLVTRSVQVHPIGQYVMSRAMRIFPALVVVAMFQVFIIGPVFTSLSLSEYFAHSRTWSHLWNGSAFWLQYDLPGVFPDNPRQTVNGSLWTLPLETFCYIVLPFLALAGLLRQSTAWLVGIGVVGGYLVARFWFGLGDGNLGPLVVKAVRLHSILTNGSYFAVGAMMWVYRDRLPLEWGYGLLAVVVAAIGYGTPVGALGFILAVSYGSMLLAFRTPIVKLPGDISYGLYLYAYPMQQTVIALFGAGIGATMVSAFALPLAVGCAILSWKWIEKPALSFRKKQREKARVAALV